MLFRIREKAAAAAALALVLVILPFSAVTARAAEKPEIAAQGAALYNATTGTFMFEKNADKKFYPASITKIMTALLVLENARPEEMVVFTDSATKNLESGAVSLALTTGDQVSVNDCLYGLLLKSANEVANGLAEHVAGSVPAFAEMMNSRAASLGATGTHFANPNGLTNSSHYTTPHDMALIAKACFENPDFLRYEIPTYHFPATINRPGGTTLTMGHKMLAPGGARYYPGILGGKTGYTSAAGNTLVTCVERDGVRLIAVIMKSASTHYDDTKKLLDYGFAEAEESGLTASVKNAAAAAGPSGAAVSPAASGTPAGTAAAETAAAGQQGPAAEQSQGAGTSAVVGPSAGTVHAETSAADETVLVTAPAAAEAPQGPGAAEQTAGTEAEQTSGPSAEGTAAAVQTAEGPSAAAAAAPAAAQGWHDGGSGWTFGKSDGTLARDERLVIGGFDYWFDENGIMITGWHRDRDGSWYYLRPSFGGMKKNAWIETDGEWYYVGPDGRMLTDTETPDGYRVNGEGRLVA